LVLRESVDTDLTGRDYPTADILIEAATELGRCAGELVAASGTAAVVPFTTAVQALRDSIADVGDENLFVDDRRLLRLAADASGAAAVSGFDELYPVTLAPRYAVELALTGKPGRQISVAAVRRSVATRFPRVVLPVQELDALVTAAMPGLVRRGDIYAPATTRDSTSTGTTGTMLTPTAAPEAATRLIASFRHNRALTLCTTPKRYVRAIRDLAESFDVEVLDVAELVVKATKGLAATYDVQWPFAVGIDAGPKSGTDWANLQSLVREAVEPRWTECLSADRPLLIVNAGPLARYGLLHLLAQLLDVGTARPAARWLLVAMHAHQPVPMLEGEQVPLGPSRWITLPADLSTLVAATRQTSNS
jgi:hypothetical protein